MFAFAFDVVLARVYGEHWALSEEERVKLSMTTARVAVKWSAFFERFGDEIALVACGAMIIVPRAMETARQMEEAKAVDGEVVG